MDKLLIRELRQQTRTILRELDVVNERLCFADLNLSEGHTLVELGQAGSLGVSELVALLLLEKSTVSRLLSGLEAKGLVVSDTDPHDRRKRISQLTEAGRGLLEELHTFADTQVIGALEYCSDDEAHMILTAQRRYARALGYARKNAKTKVRRIEPEDNSSIATIIRTVMTEFGAVGHGYSIEDAEVDSMYDVYSEPRSEYFVVEDDGKVVGGGGIGPLVGGDESICELKKMYFIPSARGRGLAVAVLKRCLKSARRFGYRTMYLETLTHLQQAQKLYQRFGFRFIESSLGATGHHKCDSFMTLEL